VVERRKVGADSVPTVDLRWEIDERTPAIINRVDILGNDVTTETCIRDQLFVVPGDVFNKQRFIDSYRNIANLGFFEQDMPVPETRPINDKGDIDLIFHVKEKRTGNVNFGASVGQGTGLGGFIGFDQPNLFGECKRGSLQWQFGQYIKDFSMSYSDPRIKQSNVSGTISAYHQQSRFIIRDIGQSVTTGGQLQFGFPLSNSQRTRLYLSYGGEKVKYGGDGLVSTIQCNGCFRSTLGMQLDHDTRLGMPFPVAGVHENMSLQLNGGPLGGTASFQRLTTEMHGYTPIATLGKAIGIEGAGGLGLTAKAGAVFGDRAVLRLPVVHDGRRAVRRASARLSRVLDHAIRVHTERRSAPGAADVVRQRLLPGDGGAGNPHEPTALLRHVLRRRKPVAASPGLRPDAVVPRRRFRRVAGDAAGSSRGRFRIRVRQDQCAGSTGTGLAGALQVR
jgi:outer membrane protein insertion porin family